MPLLVSLGDVRDIVIIVWGVIGVIFFVVALIVAIMLYFMLKGLFKSVNGLVDDSVRPTLNSVRNAAETMRGTTEFMGKTAVTPVVRAYGTFAGVKRGLSVLTSIKGKSR